MGIGDRLHRGAREDGAHGAALVEHAADDPREGEGAARSLDQALADDLREVQGAARLLPQSGEATETPQVDEQDARELLGAEGREHEGLDEVQVPELARMEPLRDAARDDRHEQGWQDATGGEGQTDGDERGEQGERGGVQGFHARRLLAAPFPRTFGYPWRVEAWGERRIRSWQGLLLLGILSLLAVQLTDVHRTGLLAQRMVLVGVMLAGVIAIGTRRWRDQAANIFTTVCFLLAWWTMAYLAIEVAAPETSLIVLVTTTAVSLVLPTFSSRAAFLLMVMVSTAVSTTLLPPLTVPGPFVVACVGVVTSIVLVHGYITDQTTSEVTELSLVASRVHNGVAMLDTRGRIEWVNASFLKLAGRTGAELRGRRLLDLLGGPGAPADSLEQLSEALRRGHQASAELPHRSALGTITWVSVDLTPVRDARGQIVRYIAVETDISRARAFLARVLDSMTDMLLVVQEGRGIRSANEAACGLLELAEGELIGRPLEEFLDEEASGAVAEGAARLRMLLTRRTTPAPGSAFGDLDLQLRSGSGASVPVRASAAVLSDEPDRQRIVVIVARDVRDRLRLQDERRQLEEKIRQGQKLESLGVLAGGIAHDFNNLLVGILGNASLAATMAGEDSEHHQLLTRIERSAQRAADLTRQMLAYSGKGRFEITEISPSELVKELSELIDASISKQAELVLEFQPALPPVEGDATQLRQVVMNLLTNASEALGEGGGRITVSGRMTTLAERDIEKLVVASEFMAPGEYVEIAVADTGQGMDAETVERMFDPFFTTKATGRGLGLAATLGIVRGHRGGLAVQSRAGIGTTVRVYLPPTPEVAGARAEEEEEVNTWSGHGAVLVADDEDEVLDFIVQVLTRKGFSVITARDGAECIDKFVDNQDRIGLLVLDLTMPRKNGDEVLRAIRPLAPDLRVILSSGYDEQETTARFGDVGPAAFLQKPYRATQLVELVRQQLGEG
ncbi:MAG: PAS domain-containing protein [Deltaproteobacteria bacterium]|nr:MAG: PAS domain-containing protein [Deltaproteobacteria bacterium]